MAHIDLRRRVWEAIYYYKHGRCSHVRRGQIVGDASATKHEKREQFGHVFHVWVGGKGQGQNMKNAAISAVFPVSAMAEGTEKNPNAKNAANLTAFFVSGWGEEGAKSNHEKRGHFGYVSGARNDRGNKSPDAKNAANLAAFWGKARPIVFIVLGEPKPN